MKFSLICQHCDKMESAIVELLGLDVFDPTTMKVESEPGQNVPAWFLDTDYNGLCFYVKQAFFPRTSAWASLKKLLKVAMKMKFGNI
jgi:hypothetical protein